MGLVVGVLLSWAGAQSLQAQGWLRQFGTGNDDFSTTVIQTRDGGYLVAGYSFDSLSNNQNKYFYKTDPNGNP